MMVKVSVPLPSRGVSDRFCRYAAAGIPSLRQPGEHGALIEGGRFSHIRDLAEMTHCDRREARR